MNERHQQWKLNVARKLTDPEAMNALEFVRDAVKDLPGINEKPCYSTPAFYAGKKLFARIREDCETFVIQTYEREKWMEKDPVTFFVTDHYLNYDYMLISLKTVEPEDLKRLLKIAWSNRATNKLIKDYEAQGNIKPE